MGRDFAPIVINTLQSPRPESLPDDLFITKQVGNLQYPPNTGNCVMDFSNTRICCSEGHTQRSKI